MTVALHQPGPAPRDFEMFPMVGDTMEPTLRGGHDLVMAVAVTRYCGEGLYVIDDGNGPSIVRCDAMVGRGTIRILHDNPISRGWQELSLASFNSMLLRFVVADIRVRDQRIVRELFDGRTA